MDLVDQFAKLPKEAMCSLKSSKEWKPRTAFSNTDCGLEESHMGSPENEYESRFKFAHPIFEGT